jgi:hypothetical protein
MPGVSQIPRYNGALLDTLEQIMATRSPSGYFARMYHGAIEATNKHAFAQPDSVRQITFLFEKTFAPLFFRAHRNFEHRETVPQEWRAYYSSAGLTELQYQFLGMNAHINGDMWVALISNFGYDTLKKYRRAILKYQDVLNPFYDSLYDRTRIYKKIKKLHIITLGFDRAYGKKTVFRWRKRQLKLAMLWYQDPRKFTRLLHKVKLKMKRLDRFAFKWMR